MLFRVVENVPNKLAIANKRVASKHAKRSNLLRPDCEKTKIKSRFLGLDNLGLCHLWLEDTGLRKG